MIKQELASGVLSAKTAKNLPPKRSFRARPSEEGAVWFFVTHRQSYKYQEWHRDTQPSRFIAEQMKCKLNRYFPLLCFII